MWSRRKKVYKAWCRWVNLLAKSDEFGDWCYDRMGEVDIPDNLDTMTDEDAEKWERIMDQWEEGL